MAFPDGGMSESTKQESLADLGEEKIVARLLAKLKGGDGVLVGPGDDCAVIEGGLLFKTDCLVEGVHFEKGADPELVGRKAMNRNLSDIAAMGGIPEYAVVTVASHPQRDIAEVEAWYSGMAVAGETFGCAIVGGETTMLPGEGAIISVAMTGRVDPNRFVTRSGAKIGDVIVVTGRLGGSFSSGRHFSFTPRIAEARWLVENHPPTAMMDLSDGLGSDLPRLAEASGVGYTVDLGKIPINDDSDLKGAISDGEDYELLMTFPSGLPSDWEKAFPGVPLTIIGEITNDTPFALERGWEHYRGS